MSETATMADTWAPDWQQIKQARHTVTLTEGFFGCTTNVQELAQAIDRAAIAEYQRQAAAAGFVMVPDDYVLDAAMLASQSLPREDGPQSDATQALYDEVNYLLDVSQKNRRMRLAATPEPASGGDGS